MVEIVAEIAVGIVVVTEAAVVDGRAADADDAMVVAVAADVMVAGTVGETDTESGPARA